VASAENRRNATLREIEFHRELAAVRMVAPKASLSRPQFGLTFKRWNREIPESLIS
jgi:hypothetical protein